MTEHFISRDRAENDLLACAAFLAESIQSNDGRSEAMMAVVPRYLDKGEVDLGAALANTVDDPFVRDRLLIAVAEKCASIDDDNYAFQLIDAIDDPGMRAQGTERVGLVLAGMGRTDRARQAADEMEHRDNVLAAIAVRQHADGNREQALDTAGEIDFPASAAHAFATMAAGSIERDDPDGSAGLLERAVGLAEQIEHDEERIRTLVDIGVAYIAARRSDKAIETFETARGHADVLDNIHRDAFLAAIAQGFMRAGSVDLADRTLDAVQDKTQIGTALLGFGRELWNKGEHDEAIEALEEGYEILRSQHERETRNTKAKFEAIINIAVQLAGFAKGERALQIAHELEDEEYSTSALRQIARVAAIQGSDELMRQALSSIRDDGQRVMTLLEMYEAVARMGNTERSSEFLNEAFALAEEVPQLASRSDAYYTLAAAYAAAGNLDLARSAARESLNTIAEIRDEAVTAASLASLAIVFDQYGFSLESEEQDLIRQVLLKAIV
jgi:tetratricopeptide (TPR) repeat protein